MADQVQEITPTSQNLLNDKVCWIYLLLWISEFFPNLNGELFVEWVEKLTQWFIDVSMFKCVRFMIKIVIDTS